MALIWNFVNPHRRIILKNHTFFSPNDTPDFEFRIENEDDDFTFILYTVILPVICSFGVIGNMSSFLVLLHIKVKCSSYTYLTVKTAADLGVCFLLLLSVLVHGIFRNMDGDDFDLLITLPVASIFNSISVLATVFVTLDRLMVLRHPCRKKKPTICTPPVARRIMAGSIFIAIMSNLPYFFIFAMKDDGFLHPTKFFYSCIYYEYNWIRFIIFGIIPSFILFVGTILLIISIQRVKRRLQDLSCKSTLSSWEPTRLTVTLIAIAIFFLVGEVPGYIVSKKAAFIFLYSGDASSVVTDDDDLFILRQISLILGAINCSINFFIFYMLHPPFGKGLKEVCCEKKKEEQKQVLVNVYVISRNQVDLKDVKRRVGTIFPKMYDFPLFVTL